MIIEIGPFLPSSLIIQIFIIDRILLIITALQPAVMVAKGIFPFANMTESCKKVHFMESFNTIYIICETFQKLVSKMPYSWQNPITLASSQPSVKVAKGKIPFAIMTHGRKGYFSL